MQLRNAMYNNELLNIKDTQQFWVYTNNDNNKLVVRPRTNISLTANSSLRLHMLIYVNVV